MELLNLTSFKDNLINNNECSFPKTRNNYKGSSIEEFCIPSDMPTNTVFDDITITPTACVALKLKRLSNNQKIFINIVCHSDIPNFPISDPYILMTNDRSFDDKGETGLICDAAVHESVWNVAATVDTSGDIMKQVHYYICFMVIKIIYASYISIVFICM